MSQPSNLHRSPVSHITFHQPNIDDTNEQNVEQTHTIKFRSQNNHLLSPQ